MEKERKPIYIAFKKKFQIPQFLTITNKMKEWSVFGLDLLNLYIKEQSISLFYNRFPYFFYYFKKIFIVAFYHSVLG